MKLSAPIYYLRRKARLLSREETISLHEALDRIAADEGFSSWSLLISKMSSVSPARKLYARLEPGDLVLLGSRPGHGKTLMSLEVVVEAMKAGNRGVFFTLEFTAKDVMDWFRQVGADASQFSGLFDFDCSDAISADYIISQLASAQAGTLVVIDYLQLLDQRRENPELSAQIRALKSFAQAKGLIVVLISQIDRSYDPSVRSCPDIRDVRMPNPVDLKLFDKTCFLNDGEVRVAVAR